MKVIKYGNKVLKKDGFIWCYEEPFTPVPFDNNVVFTPCNEEYVRFRFTASKSGYTNEDVWKNINQFSPLWLYKDGSRTEPTNNVKVVKYSDDSGYYSTYTPTGGDGVYHLDLKVSNTKGEVAPKNDTTSCGDLIIGNIIDSNVNITGTWSESNDKLTWTISRIGGYTEMVEYSELAKQIADYTVTISGAASKTDTSTTLEYSTSTLESGDYTAVIQANSSKKSGAKSAESNTITFTKGERDITSYYSINSNYGFIVIKPTSNIDMSEFISYQTWPGWYSGGMKLYVEECVVDGSNVTFNKLSDSAPVSTVNSYTRDAMTTDDGTSVMEVKYQLSTTYTLVKDKTYLILPMFQLWSGASGFVTHTKSDSQIVGLCNGPDGNMGQTTDTIVSGKKPYIKINGDIY